MASTCDGRSAAVLVVVLAACSGDDDDDRADDGRERADAGHDASAATADHRGGGHHGGDRRRRRRRRPPRPADPELVAAIEQALAAAPAGCDPLDTRAAACFPFPSNHFTVADTASDTGRRVRFPADGAPANARA